MSEHETKHSEQETKHSEPRAAQNHEVSDDQLDIAGGRRPADHRGEIDLYDYPV